MLNPFMRHRRHRWVIATLLLMVVLVAGLVLRPDRAIHVAVAMTDYTLCSEVFVSGLDPERVYREEIEPQKGIGILLYLLHYRVDTVARQVTVDWAGHFTTIASYHDGYGCSLGEGNAIPTVGKKPNRSIAPIATNEAPIMIGTPALQAALDHAFAEPPQPPYRRVRAIVVMRDGKIIAERYAPGIHPYTPLLAYSVSKSVINALVGILVREGKLDVMARAPIAAWSDPSDPRHVITLDNLLRMTSGLNVEETSSGFDPVSRMLFLEHDMAAYAESVGLKATPGRRWDYTSGNTLIVSSIVRDQVGGHAQDVKRFAERELFALLGMRHVTMEFDHAGTPIGATRMYASARDWARFGQLYLDDGVVNGQRILPQGWRAYSSRPTLDSPYGAGFWVNAGARINAGMPADTFFASGSEGQRIVIIPSQRLVIARFGVTIDPPMYDIQGLVKLVQEVIATGG